MSAIGRELELKLQASPECLQRLCDHPFFQEKMASSSCQQTLVSVYFDSDEFYLREHGVSLRVRHVGDRHFQTIKVNEPGAPFFVRAELEKEIFGDAPHLDAKECPLIPPIPEETRSKIKALFETHVERNSFQCGESTSQIEVALDSGRIRANGADMPISEIELELKRGNPGDLFDLAKSISAIIPVQLSTESKAERGYGLLSGLGNAAKAEPILLSPSLPVAKAFKIIACSCLRQILGNARGVVSRNPDALHQMRIGMRRLRAAIWVFGDILRDEQSQQIKRLLKEYARELGPARDLDVIIADVLRPFSRRPVKEKGAGSLIRLFGRQRKKAYDRAIQAITSREFRTFTIDCSAWIETGQWAATSVALEAGPVGAHAAKQIARQRRKLIKHGHHLKALEPGQVHKLRIRAKKLRYTTEFFGALYSKKKDAKRRDRFVSEMQDLQDALGRFNDLTVRRQLLVEFTGESQVKQNPAAAFAAGQIVGEQQASGRPSLKDAAEALSGLKRVKPFWNLEQRELEGVE